MHAHEFFVRHRKYGLKGFKNYKKRFVQVLPKLVIRPQKQSFNFMVKFGAKYLLRA